MEGSGRCAGGAGCIGEEDGDGETWRPGVAGRSCPGGTRPTDSGIWPPELCACATGVAIRLLSGALGLLEPGVGACATSIVDMLPAGAAAPGGAALRV
eukprot:scaffold17032_cov19-Tisochrysis_lutea.AAC.1